MVAMVKTVAAGSAATLAVEVRHRGLPQVAFEVCWPDAQPRGRRIKAVLPSAETGLGCKAPTRIHLQVVCAQNGLADEQPAVLVGGERVGRGRPLRGATRGAARGGDAARSGRHFTRSHERGHGTGLWGRKEKNFRKLQFLVHALLAGAAAARKVQDARSPPPSPPPEPPG